MSLPASSRPTPGPASPEGPAYTARCPEDLLAVVPVVIGFQPRESVVMLTFGAARAFHARVDVPGPEATAAQVAELVGLLLAPARRQAVRQVVFVVYTDRPVAADRVARRLVRRFRGAGIEVKDVLRADGRRWFPLLHGRRRHPAGVAYDVSTHPFAAQAVFDGQVTHSSREELAATLVARPEQVAAVAALLPTGDHDRAAGRGAGADLCEQAWVTATTRQLAEAGEAPDDAVAARLLAAVAGPAGSRDASWLGVPPEAARRHVELWTGLVTRAPEQVAAAAAAVLAIHAWLAGHGALAWCAVDRATELEPGQPLAELVAELLVAAVPPRLVGAAETPEAFDAHLDDGAEDDEWADAWLVGSEDE